MSLQPGKQTNAIHILLNILKSKDNQKMKFGQLIEYSVRNIFYKKAYSKWVEKLFPDPFLENQSEQISGSIV